MSYKSEACPRWRVKTWFSYSIANVDFSLNEPWVERVRMERWRRVRVSDEWTKSGVNRLVSVKVEDLFWLNCAVICSHLQFDMSHSRSLMETRNLLTNFPLHLSVGLSVCFLLSCAIIYWKPGSDTVAIRGGAGIPEYSKHYLTKWM